MSWPGIYLVHVPDGVDPDDAVRATIEGWITYDGDEVAIVPNTDPPQIPDNPDFRHLARRTLVSVNPDLRSVDGSGTLDDGRGPAWIHIYSNEVQLEPKRYWDKFGDIDGFGVMWSYCVALAEQANCVAHDPDEDGFIDLSLDVETAELVYRWI